MKTFVFTMWMILKGISLFGQYSPNTRWPYLNEHFQEGIIYFDDNKKSSAQLNIHLWGNVLHYVTPEGKIFESSDKNIVRVEIGKTAYLYGDGQLMELLGRKGNHVLLKLQKGDFDAMKAGAGAYGASLNSSASTDLNSLDLGGMDKPSLAKMQSEKNDGREIPMVIEYYFIIDGKVLKATKGEMTDFVSVANRNKWKTFLKTHKIKWRKEDSLMEILDFFTQN